MALSALPGSFGQLPVASCQLPVQVPHCVLSKLW
ncbi:MAG: hypothetical protein ACI9WS_001158, partial [Paraglaciecola psychrophila]